MTAPDRWEPDEQLVAAVMSSPKASRRMTELADPDRCWLVAGLTLAGMTAQDIADRTGCSLRLIRAIRAEAMTQVCVYAQQKVGALSDTLRQTQIELSAQRLERSRDRAEIDRLRMQVDQLVKALRKHEPVRVCPQGHPMVGYNVYHHQGREYCRECNRLRALARRRKRSRDRRTKSPEQHRHNAVVTMLHADSVTSVS